MLIEFTLENFRSFRDRAIFSMIASSDKSLPDNLSEDRALNDQKILNSAVVYGPNASGKSNLTIAMTLLRNLVLQSNMLQKGIKLNYQPFAFDSRCKQKPTTFEISFIYKHVKYNYKVSYDASRIVMEELYHYPNGRPALIFSRKGNEFEFKTDRTEQTVISKRTLENALYLSSSVQFNYHGTTPAYDWFQKNFIALDTTDTSALTELVIDRMNHDKKLKEGILKAMQIADLGIAGIEGQIRKIPIQELQGKLPPQILGVMAMMSGGEAKQTDLKFKHKVKDEKGTEQEIGLTYQMESEGTRRLFAIIGPLIDTLSIGGTLVIDELDTKLHHDISAWLISLFHDPAQNTKGAQLIFNTHDQQLLDLSRFRRDQIWFTQKDLDKGSSTLFSLADFGERKDRDVLKAYQLGRYGAVPFIAPEKVV